MTSRSGFETRPPISLTYKDVMRSLRMAERESVPAGGGSSLPFPGDLGGYARPALRPVCGLKTAALQDGRERVTLAPT